MEWQPIETAPRDGNKLILGAWADDGYSNVILAGLEPYGSTQGDTTRPRAVFGLMIFYPTHWLPIPPRPSRTETAQKRPISTEINVNEQRTYGDSGTNKLG